MAIEDKEVVVKEPVKPAKPAAPVKTEVKQKEKAKPTLAEVIASGRKAYNSAKKKTEAALNKK